MNCVLQMIDWTDLYQENKWWKSHLLFNKTINYKMFLNLESKLNHLQIPPIWFKLRFHADSICRANEASLFHGWVSRLHPVILLRFHRLFTDMYGQAEPQTSRPLGTSPPGLEPKAWAAVRSSSRLSSPLSTGHACWLLEIEQGNGFGLRPSSHTLTYSQLVFLLVFLSLCLWTWLTNLVAITSSPWQQPHPVLSRQAL